MRGGSEDVRELLGIEGFHRRRHLLLDVCPTLRFDIETGEQRLRDQRNGDPNTLAGELGGVGNGEAGLTQELQAEFHRGSAVGREQHSRHHDSRGPRVCAQGAHEVLVHGAQLVPPRGGGIHGDLEVLADAVAHGVE
ncbi:hypothetical protein AYK61_25095 [Rhodococcus sp. SBT000017]|nr:hypothetical protein AYK61_25095 [Rhodococcus sp. SBT000017]